MTVEPHQSAMQFHKAVSYERSKLLYLVNIEILPHSSRVLAGSCRHRDGESLSPPLTDIRLWDLETGAFIKRFGLDTQTLWRSTVSPNEEHVLTAGYIEEPIYRQYLYLWSIEKGEILREFEEVPATDCLAFSPCGNFALSGHRDGSIHYWEIQTGKPLQTFTGHLESIISVSFSPDGQFALSACCREYVCIWELATGTLLKRFGGSNSGASEVSFSANSRFVAFSGSYSFEEMDALEEAAMMDDDFMNTPEMLRYKAVQRKRSIRIWDLQIYKEHCRLRTNNPVGGSQEGCYIVLNTEGTLGISFSDGITHLWDISQGHEIGQIEHYTSHASFSSGINQYVLAGSAMHGISLYKLPSQNTF